MNERARCRSKRRILRWSLRTFLLSVTAIGIGLGWLGARLQTARQQREAVEVLESKGASVFYDYQVGDDSLMPDAKLWTPTWLRSWLGEDFFAKVVVVQVGDSINKEDAERMAKDAAEQGMSSSITYLALAPPKLHDSELTVLHQLPHLRWLSLRCRNVTDDGVTHIQSLRRLERLRIVGTSISNAGVKQLEIALPECEIETVEILRQRLSREWELENAARWQKYAEKKAREQTFREEAAAISARQTPAVTSVPY